VNCQQRPRHDERAGIRPAIFSAEPARTRRSRGGGYMGESPAPRDLLYWLVSRSYHDSCPQAAVGALFWPRTVRWIACPGTSDTHGHGRPMWPAATSARQVLSRAGGIAQRMRKSSSHWRIWSSSVQEVADRADGEVDAMKKVKSPPDDLVAGRASRRAGAPWPAGRRPVRLVACTRAASTAVNHASIWSRSGHGSPGATNRGCRTRRVNTLMRDGARRGLALCRRPPL
jgi:hypothetical protein